MNIFMITELIFSSIVFVVSESYNYNGQQTLTAGLKFANGDQSSPLIMQILSPPIQQQQQIIEQVHLERSNHFESNPTPTSNFLNGGSTPHNFRHQAQLKKPFITKSFFIHSAPEESDDDIREEHIQYSRQQQPHRHYNVLFIRAPSQTHRTTALNFAKALNEEKTVVYVLTKKTTAADLHNAIRDVPQKIQKPDVFFIKYRTPEEAANAQRQIQSQYDSLGGTSFISDEGIAPVTSVIGSLDDTNEQHLQPDHQQDGEPTIGQSYEDASEKSIKGSPYLPPQH